MNTATAEPQVAQETVEFYSWSDNQILTRKKTRHIDDGLGGKRVLTEEDWLETQRSVNDQRAIEGKEPLEIDESPWKIYFTDNAYKTSDPTIIRWLREHPCFNRSGPSGFWELAKPPGLLEPTEAEQLREVQQSSLHRDLFRAEAALQVEQETHNRPTVLKAAAEAVDSIRDLAADAPGADSQGDPPGDV